ncbi:MAG: hypothetical protein JNM10_19255 [Planctomycetia bacterium]|nr:hypothetical protein [Planctomycetia bacterium]
MEPPAPAAIAGTVAAREMFVRCLAAGGVALGVISLAFALAAPPRWDLARVNVIWQAADVAAASLGLWVALAARWIARALPWPTDLLHDEPPVPRRASRGLAVGVGLLLAVALFLPYVPSRPTWHPPFDPVVAALAVGVTAVLAASATPAVDPLARVSRLGAGLAVTRAGGLLGCAAVVRSLVQLVPTGRWSDADVAGLDLAGLDLAFRRVEPIVGALAFTGLAFVEVLPWRRERRDPRPASHGTLLAAVAVVAAGTLVGPIVEETMRWRAGRRFQTQHSIDWQWPGDFGEAVRGYAERAGLLAAGFAGFVLVAAIAGRRGRGDARPGR